MRIALGLVFLASGTLKCFDPVGAVLAVGAYDLLPPEAALAVGLLLPGIEVAAGAALLTEFLARGGAGAAAGLSAGFLVFVLTAWLRGLDVSCGCFGPLSAAIRAGWEMALLDAALLALSLAVLRSTRGSSGSPPAGRTAPASSGA